MQPVSQVLSEVKDLYQKILGEPAPEIAPVSCVAFPPGVDPLHHAVHEFDELKKLSERMAFAPGPAAWVPPSDTFVTQDAYLIRVDIPGLKREDLKVFITGGECVVRGDRKVPEGSGEMRFVAVERPRGPFERRFPLPPGCRSERVTARYIDGVLELKIAFEGNGAPKEMNVEVV